ncbi:hypothetical protein PSPO01_16553 [Paraphaeosphaeria sporulosa]
MLGLVWWSLYCLEQQLSVITGRPSAVADSCCSVPLPSPEHPTLENVNTVGTMLKYTSAAQAPSGGHLGNPPSFAATKNSSLSYFKAVVQMCIIKQSILTSLYSAGAMTRSLGDLQHEIIQIEQRIDDWAFRLPVDYNFHTPFDSPDTVAFRQRTLLNFQYCSAKILLTRPCLNGSRMENKGRAASVSFSQRMARICVDAAKMAVGLLPDQPQPCFAYQFGPWWTLVHHLMQAFAVLLLSLSRSPSTHQDTLTLAGYCMKIINWLHAMEDPQAERAHQLASRCYGIVASQLSPGSRIGTGYEPQRRVPRFNPNITDVSSQRDLATEADGISVDPAFLFYASNASFDPLDSRPLYDTACGQGSFASA